MKTSQEQLENYQVKVTVTVEKDEVKKYIDDTYKEVAKKYRIPGFRPGKANRKVLDTYIGKEAILGDATNLLLNVLEPKVQDAEDIAPIGDPIYDIHDGVEIGEPYTYEVVFNVKPELELNSYDPVEIEMPALEASEAEIQQQMDRFLSFYAKFEDSTSKRMAKKGDFLELALTGDENSQYL
ncbi:MAG: trigger factor family protein, partial [Coriobacteriia bacterium]|nr:trigger factor family protein [Coriobacteriia bacterium]